MQDMTSLQNRFRVKGQITTTSGMRIGAGRSADLLGSDLPIVLDAQSRPYIPGSSIKGVFRTHAEQIVNGFITTPTDPTGVMQQDNKIREGPGFRDMSDENRYLHITAAANEIVKLFGSTLIAGRIFFRDAMVTDTSFSYVETRNGVQIDRDTGSQKRGLLYNYDTVPAGVSFSFELVIDNATDIQLGLVLLILDSWKSNGFQLGGFTRRGLGWMELTNYSESFNEIKGAADLIALLKGGDNPVSKEKREDCLDALTTYLTTAGA